MALPTLFSTVYCQCEMHVRLYQLLALITVLLGKRFPEERPILILQSIYHEHNDIPFQSKDCTMPYSPRWSTDVMAEKARYSRCYLI